MNFRLGGSYVGWDGEKRQLVIRVPKSAIEDVARAMGAEVVLIAIEGE